MASRTRVGSYSYTNRNGKQVRVGSHSRRGLSRQRAWRHARMAGRALARSRHASPERRRQLRTAAFVAASAATVEIGAWGLMRGTGLVVGGIGIAGLAAYKLSRRYAQ